MNNHIFIVALLAPVMAGAQPVPVNPEAPAAPQSEMQKWIATTDAQWQAAFKRDVSDVRDAELNKTKLQYLAALEDGIKKACAANDLKGAVALRNEQKRFGDTQVFRVQDDDADAAPVKAVRAQLAKVEKDHAARAKTLHAKYDQFLANTRAQLTQRQRLDDALLVQTKRDEVATAWITTVVPSPAPTSASTTQPLKKAVVPQTSRMANPFLENHRRRAVAGAAKEWTVYMQKLSEELASLHQKESTLKRMLQDAEKESVTAVTVHRNGGSIKIGDARESRADNVARISGNLADTKKVGKEVEAEIARWSSFLERVAD